MACLRRLFIVYLLNQITLSCLYLYIIYIVNPLRIRQLLVKQSTVTSLNKNVFYVLASRALFPFTTPPLYLKRSVELKLTLRQSFI